MIGFVEVNKKTRNTQIHLLQKYCKHSDWIFLISLVLVASVVIVLYIIKVHRETVQNVPFNPKTWFDEMIRTVQKLESDQLLSSSIFMK